MARPEKHRKVFTPPRMYGFKPFGIAICESESVILHFDEYEAFKLVNYDNLSQDEASDLMNVSRPTFTRIYNKALQKIAMAFTEGKAILISGGNIEFDKEWFRCRRCFRLIEGMENHIKCDGCNRYGPDELVSIKDEISPFNIEE
ncbi:MAG TPA: DUF134 domain-containing protein [Prolixibacteraceae bacterium]|nr:DUF134 domain-containing protein [Prolixibacteraceae bacterium]